METIELVPRKVEGGEEGERRAGSDRLSNSRSLCLMHFSLAIFFSVDLSWRAREKEEGKSHYDDRAPRLIGRVLDGMGSG